VKTHGSPNSNTGDFEEIERVIKETHHCETRYLCSRQVTQNFRDGTAWKVIVDVFTLLGHPKAQRCYGWQYQEGGQTKTITVPEIPPVNSAETAVKTFHTEALRMEGKSP